MHQGPVAVLATLGAAAGSIEHLRRHALGVDQGLGEIRSLMQRNEVILGARGDPPPRIGCFDALFQRKTAQRQQETRADPAEY